MFKKDQLNQIEKEKNSAFKILIDTQDKLKKSCEKALSFIAINSTKVNEKEFEIVALKSVNSGLDTQIKSMEASIKQTDNIINPVIDDVV